MPELTSECLRIFRTLTLSVTSLWCALYPVSAMDLLVYNTNDAGSGSLREAVVNNNTLGGGNNIVFSNVVSGAITLINGELLITENVTILGPGANVLAINGNHASRVF